MCSVLLVWGLVCLDFVLSSFDIWDSQRKGTFVSEVVVCEHMLLVMLLVFVFCSFGFGAVGGRHICV